MKDETPEHQGLNPNLRPGKGGIVPPVHARFKPGQSGNPGGRKKGEIFISEAVRFLLRGDKPHSDSVVWKIAANIVGALQDERLDSRLLSLVLDRLEGKVPDRIEATVASGVVLVPKEQMEAEAWARLAAATLALQQAETRQNGERNGAGGPLLLLPAK